MGEASIQIGSEGWPKNHISVVRQELNYDKTNNCINSGSVELIVLKWPKFKRAVATKSLSGLVHSILHAHRIGNVVMNN